jgi:hypothetical protein
MSCLNMLPLVACLILAGSQFAKGQDQDQTVGTKELAVQYMLGQPDRLKEKLAEIKEHLVAMKKGKIDRKQGIAINFKDGIYSFASQESKTSWIKRKENQIKELQNQIDGFKSGNIIMPDLLLDEIGVGKAGILTYPGNVNVRDPKEIKAKIIQIVNDNEMLMEIFGQTFWVKLPTEGLVDDKQIILNGLFVVICTKKYSTSMGGSKTVYVIERIDPNWLKTEVNQRFKKGS